jgi:hypothetical protein
MFGRRKKPPFSVRLQGWLWPALGWRRLGIYLLKRLIRLGGTPHSIACGFACGVAISFTPFIGLHIILGTLMAWLLRGHLIAAAVGTVIGDPWTFPFIWFATYKVGQTMLGNGEAAPWPAVIMFKHVITDLGGLIWPTLTGEGSWEGLRRVLLDLGALIWPMFVGSLPLGMIAWVASYLPLAKAIDAFQQARDRRRRQGEEGRRLRALASATSAVDPKRCAS